MQLPPRLVGGGLGEVDVVVPRSPALARQPRLGAADDEGSGVVDGAGVVLL